MKTTDMAIPSPRVPKQFQRFVRKFVQGSYPLFAAAVAALLWANLSQETYHAVWHAELSFSLGSFQVSKSIAHWIDEALMVIFFFTVGLEIKREILVGGLSSPKQALLPIAAALGGMVVPAAIYLSFNPASASAKGWGIPMATDIAFSLAVLGLVGRRIPLGIKLFLSAFAIADDLGAVLVIALFYTQSLHLQYLLVAGVFLAGLAGANRLWIRSPLTYAILGIGLWTAILGSGIHATVAGVVVAMFIPARGRYDTATFTREVQGFLDALDCEADACGQTILLNRQHQNTVQAIDLACRDVETPLQRMEHALQPWIVYLILPVFALAHAGLELKGLDVGNAALHPVTVGVVLGLVAGKPAGIFVFTAVAAKLFRAPLHSGVGWRHILGVGFLGGIGFTMSLFIAGLSFVQPELLEFAKLGIVAGSILAGVIGFVILKSGGSPQDTAPPGTEVERE